MFSSKEKVSVHCTVLYNIYAEVSSSVIREEKRKRNHSDPDAKLYIPSTLNIDLILWHTQLIVCAENVKSWFK